MELKLKSYMEKKSLIKYLSSIKYNNYNYLIGNVTKTLTRLRLNKYSLNSYY